MTAFWPSARRCGERYLAAGWGDRVFTWHEAADVTRLPPASRDRAGARPDLGRQLGRRRTLGGADGVPRPRRCAELGLTATVHGVRYPDDALAALADGRHRLCAARSPTRRCREAFARHRVTVHVPRATLRRGAARHPDHPPVRGAGLRHPAGLRALGRCRGTVPPRHRLPDRARRERDEAPPDRRAVGSGAGAANSPRTGSRPIAARHTCRHRAQELLAILERHRRRTAQEMA